MVIKANGLTIKGFLSFQLSFTVYICILFLVFTCWVCCVCSQVPVFDLYPVSCWCTCRVKEETKLKIVLSLKWAFRKVSNCYVIVILYSKTIVYFQQIFCFVKYKFLFINTILWKSMSKNIC